MGFDNTKVVIDPKTRIISDISPSQDIQFWKHELPLASGPKVVYLARRLGQGDTNFITMHVAKTLLQMKSSEIQNAILKVDPNGTNVRKMSERELRRAVALGAAVNYDDFALHILTVDLVIRLAQTRYRDNNAMFDAIKLLASSTPPEIKDVSYASIMLECEMMGLGMTGISI
jgi:hypothetical protein